jgi:hypothetical protein
MTAVETASELCALAGRRGGSDAERRAGLWLSDRLRIQGRAATIETFWCRPNWALAHAWHAAFGLGASVLIVAHARIGGAVALVTVASIACDAATGRSLGRRLTPERASQNVVAPDPAGASDTARLVVTANYDAGRAGLVYRAGPRTLATTLRRAAAGGRLTPGWLGWLTIALLWLVVIAIVRNGGTSGTPVDLLQLVPSIGLLASAIALLELSVAATSPGASDNAAGVAVALETVAALDARHRAHPPGHVAVDLVLQGASDGDGTGLRRHLRRSRRARPIVIGIAPCGSGSPGWWRSDGPLWPLRYDRRLTALAASASANDSAERAADSPSGRRGRGTTPALTARAAGLPAISIGCVEKRGLAPRSHRPTDVADALEPGSLEAATSFAVELITAIESNLPLATRA